jgi:DNA replication and repair protein RecF
MILSSIQLRNFRSHKNTTLNLSPRVNYIIGGNGQGKTSVIEAIFYLCTTKSHCAKIDREAVSFNEESFEITGRFRGATVNKVDARYSINENKKYYFRDEKRITRIIDIIGKFPVVLLTPDDHAITQGAPRERRKFIDSVISQASETYLRNLLEYNKTLRQRSALLSRIKEFKDKKTSEELEAWSSILVRTGSYIIRQRKQFIEIFDEYINQSYKAIMEGEEKPSISYIHLEGYTGNEVEREFERLLIRRKEEEKARGTNLVGPQRDDFIFDINGYNLKTYGSQGQHKTFQVALRFAEFFYLKEITGITPIFLLDDIFGELDTNRASKISQYLTGVGQAFITSTDLSNLTFLKKGRSDMVIRLKAGEVTYA